MNLINRFFKSFKDETTKVAQTQKKDVNSKSEIANDLLDKIMDEAFSTNNNYYFVSPSNCLAYEELKSKSDEFLIEFIHVAVHRLILNLKSNQYGREARFIKALLGKLFRKKLPYSMEDLEKIALELGKYRNALSFFPANSFLNKIKILKAKEPLSEKLINAIKALQFEREYIHSPLIAEQRNINNLIDRMIMEEKNGLQVKFDNDEFGEVLNSFFNNLGEADSMKWASLVNHFAGKLSQSKPTLAWYKQTQSLLKDIGEKAVLEKFIEWIELAGTLYNKGVKASNPRIMSEINEHFVRNIVWAAGIINEDKLTDAVEDLGLECMKKVKNYGQISRRIGNACLICFAKLPFNVGIQRLTKFRSKTKYPSIKSIIANRIKEVAKREGKMADEIEELGVSNFGLNAGHQIIKLLGNYKAVVTIDSLTKVNLLWEKSDGKMQKTIPTVIKEDFKVELNEIKRAIKDIKTALPAQRDRIERFFLKQRTWEYKDWFDNYIAHPLVGYLGKKLIWFFEKDEQKAIAIYDANKWVNSKGEICDWIDESTKVQLWHPIGFSPQFISDWRNYLVNSQIQQPLKQAFREIYIITDAELNTRSYSNRFAAHILRQFQFTSLCKLRGWHYTLQGAWDSHNTPGKILEDWNIRVEFWVEADHQGDTAATGIFEYVFSDQVRFYEGERQLNMDEVPALVFSELMREVDMFVGVSSIGNDENWTDTGNDRYHNYWRAYSQQELTQTANTRKEILKGLIPRLKIGGQCSFSDRHLIVKGDLRTYKIHLGSGNILMEPNDQYLCIVADRSSRKTNKVFLPFEGDQMLSIILSKAFLLAEDKKITDPTIIRQIR